MCKWLYIGPNTPETRQAIKAAGYCPDTDHRGGVRIAVAANKDHAACHELARSILARVRQHALAGWDPADVL